MTPRTTDLELSCGLPPGPDFADLAVLAEELGYRRVWIGSSARRPAGLEALAAQSETTLDDILAEVIDQLTMSVAFIEMIDPATSDPRLVAVHARLQDLLARKLNRPAKRLRRDVTAEELMLAPAMVAGLLARTDEKSRRAVAADAWALLRRGLQR